MNQSPSSRGFEEGREWRQAYGQVLLLPQVPDWQTPPRQQGPPLAPQGRQMLLAGPPPPAQT